MWRLPLLVLWVGYVGWLAFVVLQPTPTAAGAGLDLALELAHEAGFGFMTAARLEVALNVALFVPLGLLGALLFPRTPWLSWVALGMSVSVGFELAQRAWLPERVATPRDVGANTAGALVGALLAVMVHREVASVRSGRSRAPAVLPWGALAAAGVLVAAGMAALVLSPTQARADQVIAELVAAMHRLDAPYPLTSGNAWEHLLNVALFVPLGVLAVLLRPGWTVVRWAVVGAAASLAVELAQALALPGRDGSVEDVLLNTAGLVTGVVLGRTAVVVAGGYPRTSPAPGAPPARKEPRGSRV
jgi:glycopeptide antibiotics resistance protein